MTREMDLVLIKSVRNLPKVDATTVGDLNARSVLLRKNLVFTPEAFDSLLARDWMFGVKAKADSAQVAEDAAAEGGAVS